MSYLSDRIGQLQKVASAASRETFFPDGEELEFYEMAPDGMNLIWSMSENWRAVRVEPKGDQPEFWQVGIGADYIDSDVMERQALIKIGLKTFNVKTTEAPTGNLGLWRLRGQIT